MVYDTILYLDSLKPSKIKLNGSDSLAEILLENACSMKRYPLVLSTLYWTLSNAHMQHTDQPPST